MRVLGGVFWLTVLAGLASAQARVWVVDKSFGPGFDHVNIVSAVNASSEGDVILVRSGEYAGFVVDGKSLVIAADEGAVVDQTSGITIENLAPGQSVTLRGLGFQGDSYLGNVHLVDNQGAVWIEDCGFNGWAFEYVGLPFSPEVVALPSMVIERSASVTLVRTAVGVPFDPPNSYGTAYIALKLRDGNANLFDSQVYGGGQEGSTGSVAMNVADGLLFASGSHIVGGPGDPAHCHFGSITEPGQCWPDGPGGYGAWVGEGGRLVRLGGVLQGGPGPAGQGGEFAPWGAGEVETLAGTPRHLIANSPVREGESWQVDLEGEPGDVALLAMATRHLPLGYYAPWKGALLNVLPISISVLGVVPPEGVLTLSGVVEDVYDPGEGLPLFFQGAVITPAGEIVLTPGTVQLQLDSAL